MGIVCSKSSRNKEANIKMDASHPVEGSGETFDINYKPLRKRKMKRTKPRQVNQGTSSDDECNPKDRYETWESFYDSRLSKHPPPKPAPNFTLDQMNKANLSYTDIGPTNSNYYAGVVQAGRMTSSLNVFWFTRIINSLDCFCFNQTL